MICQPWSRRRGYIRRGVHAFYTYTGTHAKTVVFGLLTPDGRGVVFRQYRKFDKHASAKFLKAAVRRFKKICMILDDAPQHKARMIRDLVDSTDGLTLKFLPATIPELSARAVLEGTQAQRA